MKVRKLKENFYEIKEKKPGAKNKELLPIPLICISIDILYMEFFNCENFLLVFGRDLSIFEQHENRKSTCIRLSNKNSCPLALLRVFENDLSGVEVEIPKSLLAGVENRSRRSNKGQSKRNVSEIMYFLILKLFDVDLLMVALTFFMNQTNEENCHFFTKHFRNLTCEM